MRHTHSENYRPSTWQLVLASGARPCPVCGQAIEVSRTYHYLVGIAGLLVMGFAVAFTMRLRSYWPACAGLCIVLFSQYLVARFAPLATVSQQEQINRKWAGWGFLGLLVVLLVLTLFLG